MYARFFTFCLLLLLTSGGPAFGQSGASYVVIVNADNKVQSVSRDDVADMFLRRTTFWGSGEVVRPVDLPSNSSLRQRFSRDVLRRSENAVRTYWQQRIFTGRGVPPPEVASEQQAIAYVQSHPGAIGYVPASTPLPDGVHAVMVR